MKNKIVKGITAGVLSYNKLEYCDVNNLYFINYLLEFIRYIILLTIMKIHVAWRCCNQIRNYIMYMYI